MNSLFRRTFTAFVLSLAVLLVVLAGALVGGYNYSMTTWSERRVAMIREAAEEILRAEQEGEEAGDRTVIMPQDVPVFVYDERGRIVASNRGIGRRRELEQGRRLPVEVDGSPIGFVSVGSTAFGSDAANRALVRSLLIAAGVGVLAALGAAGAVAWAFARSLSGPAARVAEGIDRIAHGSPSEPIPEEGAEEVVRIAHAANTLSRRLEEEHSLRAQWARDVTHDLRTPIASVRSQLEAVVDGVFAGDPETIRGTLDEIGRVEGLIDDLDELMRLEEPDVHLSVEPLPVHSLAGTVRQRFARNIDLKNLRFETHFEVDEVHGDDKLIDRAVSNLVSNAVRHTPEGGRIALHVDRSADGGTRIAVVNEGEVIPAEELEHVFDRLYRGEYARNSPGSGLGLTIARRIALVHGGDVSITSDETEGTTVSILLP